MSMGTARDVRTTSRGAVASARRHRELQHVRHPLQPGHRLERVVVCASGVHVVTNPSETDGGPGAVLLSTCCTAAEVVRSLLPPRYHDRVRPVLCLTTPEPTADLVDGVLVTTRDTFEHIIRSSPVVLSTSEVNEIALRLDAVLEPFPAAPRTGDTRHRGRRTVLATVAAATSAAAVVLLEALGALPLP